MRASVTNARQALPPLEAQPVVEPVTRGPSNLWKGKVAVRAAQLGNTNRALPRRPVIHVSPARPVVERQGARPVVHVSLDRRLW